MKVKELIKKLREFDENKEINVDSYGECITLEIGEIGEENGVVIINVD